MHNIVCVQSGNYCGRGKEYVNNLFDMIKRNTTKQVRYICFTDDPEGLDPYIETRPLPGFLMGWWNKLYLFSKEAGLEGQNFFFDLDTLILANIDDLLEYDGEFMILRDFYRPEGLGSGLMSWRGHHDIWEKYKEANYPHLAGGDQAFIETVVSRADLWQEKYPQSVASYKATKFFSEKTSVICFHGNPRPHEVLDSWVGAVWRKGGAQDLSGFYKKAMNTSVEKVLENVRENCKRDIPWLQGAAPHNGTLCIVGGAPSLKKNLGEMKKRIRLGADVMSLNGCTKFLKSVGAKPTFHVQFDAREENAEFIDDFGDVIYLLGSMSHPCVFEKAKDYKVTIWHAGIGDNDENQKALLEILESFPRSGLVIPGGATVGLRALFLGYTLGYRKFLLFGMDSSYEDDNHHAYEQKLNDNDNRQEVWLRGKKYYCARWMYRQAEEFRGFFWQLYKMGCWIDAVGEGLLPDLCREMNRQIMEQKNASSF